MWNNLTKSKTSQQKKVSCITIIFASSLIFILALPSLNNLIYAQITGTTTTSTTTSLPDPNRLIVMVNIERIRNQILLTERSLTVGDNDMAFAHSYIPHSAIFPSIKSQLNDINSQSAIRLESLLTDLPIIIKTSEEADSKGKIKNDLTEIEELSDNISNQSTGKDLSSSKTMISHTIVFF
jgi:high-affinity iron transporter